MSTTKEAKLWNAFCTMHWFVTGEHEIQYSLSPYTSLLYEWYLFVTTEVRWGKWIHVNPSDMEVKYEQH